jgi:hypothetical protein
MFDHPGELVDGITIFLEEVQPSQFHVVFSHWLERVRWVLENNGHDHHESIFRGQKRLSVGSQKGWRHYLLISLYYLSQNRGWR